MKTKLYWRLSVFLSVVALSAACGSKARPDMAAPAPTLKVNTNLINIPPDSPQLTQLRVEPVKLETLPAGEVTAPGKIEASPNRISRVPLPVAGSVSQTR